MKKGFTLIELLAVLALIGILSALIIPNVVDLYSESMDKSMKISENEILDATNIYLEDYCRNPINDTYKVMCNSDKHEINTNKVYFCLNTLTERKIIDQIYYKDSTTCSGIIVYDVNSNKYLNGKVYLMCSDNYNNSSNKYATSGSSDYLTEGYESYEGYINNCMEE